MTQEGDGLRELIDVARGSARKSIETLKESSCRLANRNQLAAIAGQYNTAQKYISGYGGDKTYGIRVHKICADSALATADLDQMPALMREIIADARNNEGEKVGEVVEGYFLRFYLALDKQIKTLPKTDMRHEKLPEIDSIIKRITSRQESEMREMIKAAKEEATQNFKEDIAKMHLLKFNKLAEKYIFTRGTGAEKSVYDILATSTDLDKIFWEIKKIEQRAFKEAGHQGATIVANYRGFLSDALSGQKKKLSPEDPRHVALDEFLERTAHPRR